MKMIKFENRANGSLRLVKVPDKPKLSFYIKWFNICKKEKYTEMSKLIRNDGTNDYFLKISAPNKFADFKEQMETL